MKAMTIGIVCVLLVGAVVIAVVPAAREEVHWRWACHNDDAASYESYLAAWPAGRYLDDARTRGDEHAWSEAETGHSIRSYDVYLSAQPGGSFARDAESRIAALRTDDGPFDRALAAGTEVSLRQFLADFPGHQKEAEAERALRALIESRRWEAATAADTIRAFAGYLESHPEGRFVEDAESRIAALRTDDTPFDRALEVGTEASLRQFLADFPGHQKEAEAERARTDITEGREIVDLLAAEKIEIETEGSGIESVRVRLRRLVPYPITVRLPVGTYFVAARQSTQNMVTTAERRVQLTGDGWHSLSVDAACANRRRAIPGGSDTFSVERSSHQDDLTRLMPVLQRANVDSNTRQAAVWIVTDNADYGDLGVLTSQPAGFSGGFGGRRVIGELEAVRAMRICEEAGIDITEKRIWRDRQRLIDGLSEGDLRSWLQENPLHP